MGRDGDGSTVPVRVFDRTDSCLRPVRDDGPTTNVKTDFMLGPKSSRRALTRARLHTPCESTRPREDEEVSRLYPDVPGVEYPLLTAPRHPKKGTFLRRETLKDLKTPVTADGIQPPSEGDVFLGF